MHAVGCDTHDQTKGTLTNVAGTVKIQRYLNKKYEEDDLYEETHGKFG